MKAKVFVTLKSGVLDPQGLAVGKTLQRLGFGEVGDVRIGKYVEISLGAQDPAADPRAFRAAPPLGIAPRRAGSHSRPVRRSRRASPAASARRTPAAGGARR